MLASQSSPFPEIDLQLLGNKKSLIMELLLRYAWFVPFKEWRRKEDEVKEDMVIIKTWLYANVDELQ